MIMCSVFTILGHLEPFMIHFKSREDNDKYVKSVESVRQEFNLTIAV